MRIQIENSNRKYRKRHEQSTKQSTKHIDFISPKCSLKMKKSISIFAVIMNFLLAFSYSHQHQKYDPSKDPFIKAANFSIQASNLINSKPTYEKVEPAIMDSIIKLNRLALKYAKQVDPKELDIFKSGMGELFQQNLLKGLKSFIDGHDNGDPKKFTEGQILINKWWDWYDENVKKKK